MDTRTIRLLTQTARQVEDEGLTATALARLERADVTLSIDWHPSVVDAWRATVSFAGRPAPLVVDRDATTAAVRALRAAAVHGVGGDWTDPFARRGPRAGGAP